MFVGWRIIDRGINCFATLTIPTRSNMSPSFVIPNWVRAFPTVIGFKLFCFRVPAIVSLRRWVCSSSISVRPQCLFVAGQFLWRCHIHGPLHLHRVLRTSCMQLLPLIEMYCRWELGEDCSDLRSLMLRFDSELELETHELGRSLLFMVRSDDASLYNLQPPVASVAQVNPFDAVRERLSAVTFAIKGLQDQVLLVLAFLAYVHAGFVLCTEPNFFFKCALCDYGDSIETTLVSTT